MQRLLWYIVKSNVQQCNNFLFNALVKLQNGLIRIHLHKVNGNGEINVIILLQSGLLLLLSVRAASLSLYLAARFLSFVLSHWAYSARSLRPNTHLE